MTLSEETRKRVEKATVRLTKKSGQGVIVPDGLILTAAHCIEWCCEGGMVLGDFFLEEIEFGGQKIVAQVYAVEPVSDIAVLGRPTIRRFTKRQSLMKRP
jgi:S1-C subfamily serine protease